VPFTLTLGLDVRKGNIGRGTDTRLDSIAWGCLLSALVHARSRHLEWISSSRTLIVVLILSIVDFAIRDERYRQTLHYTVQGFALVPVFHALFVSHRWLGWVERVLEHKSLVFVGKISYSLYLYHFLVLECATLLMPPGTLRYVVVIVGGLLAATLSWKFVETPLRLYGSRLAKSFDKSHDVPASALVSIGSESRVAD